MESGDAFSVRGNFEESPAISRSGLAQFFERLPDTRLEVTSIEVGIGPSSFDSEEELGTTADATNHY